MLLAEETVDIAGLIWTFLNSSVGLTLVGSLLVFILGKIFTAKPAWEKTFDKFRPLFFDAVRQGEKAIPDDVKSSAGQKADAALKYVLNFGPLSFNKMNDGDLQKALAKAHEERERRAKPAIAYNPEKNAWERI